MATRNRNLDKRMNYFERQFLRAQDLMDEQDYHQDRRIRLLRSLYTPGVAEGLDVKPGSTTNTIFVTAGTAIDTSGHMIVLLTQIALTLRTDATDAEIYIGYTEAESDASSDPGITGNTRIREAPAITQRRVAPSPEAAPPNGILLAAVKLNGGQLVPGAPGSPNPDTGVSTAAGSVLGDDISARSLRIRNDSVAPALTPLLFCSGPNQLAIGGASLHFDAQPREILFQDNGQIRSFDDNHRIVFARPANRLELREFGDITFNTGGAGTPERMRVAASGNVGIGTAAPAALLDLQGGGGKAKGIRLGSSAGPETFLFPTVSAPDAGVLAFGDGSGWKFHIARSNDAGATRFVTFQDNGHVGIGDDTPYATLTVHGTVGFSNGTTPLFYMFESGTSNPDRPIISHSPAAPNWGLMYRDTADHMIFQNGNPVMTVDLAQSRVGIGTAAPSSLFQISSANTAINLASSAMVIENSNTTAGQSLVSFSFGGVQKGSLRTDFVGNFVINAASGQIFLNNDFGGPPVLRPAGGAMTVVGNLIVQGALVAPNKSGCVTDQFVNRYDDTLEQGDVVVIGLNQTSQYRAGADIPIPEVDIAATAYDRRVCGIVASVHGEAETPAEGQPASAQPRMYTGDELEKMDRTKVAPGQFGYMVTLGAYACCKVDASFAPIEIGDPLTTSPTKGHAQKALDLANAAGAIIGKALAPCKEGKGVIPVIVLLR